MAMAIKIKTARPLALLACAILLCCAATAFTVTTWAQTQAPSLRTISGQITDGHEPLHGAVVELQNTDSHQVVSFLTTEDGRYIFKRVDSHADFELWATFRGHKSPIRTISKFDSQLDKVINLVCKTY